MVVPDDLAHTLTSSVESTNPVTLPVTLPLPIMTYLVVLQIPALDLLVFSTGEQVGAAAADRHTTHCANVSCEGQFQFPTGQVPNL